MILKVEHLATLLKQLKADGQVMIDLKLDRDSILTAAYEDTRLSEQVEIRLFDESQVNSLPKIRRTGILTSVKD